MSELSVPKDAGAVTKSKSKERERDKEKEAKNDSNADKELFVEGLAL